MIFLKGCPLSCIWCSNPESQSHTPQIAYSREKCIGCGQCIDSCGRGALSRAENGTITIDRMLCVNCHQCVYNCCAKALHVFGEEMTVEQVYNKTQKYGSAWRANGGVTISGGEPLLQSDFVEELLKKFKETGIDTAIETSGFAPWEDMQKVVKWCDLVFYDIKMINSDKHREYTGVDNSLILNNLKRLRENFPNLDLIIRTPVIPEINDSIEDLKEVEDFLETLSGIKDYELMPFHNYGSVKYEQLGMNYLLKTTQPKNKVKLQVINDQIRSSLRHKGVLLPKEG